MNVPGRIDAAPDRIAAPVCSDAAADGDPLALGDLVAARFRIRTLAEARNLARYLARSCPDPAAMNVGLLELLVNSVEHGNLGITYDEKTALLAGGTWLAEVEHRLALPQYAAKSTIVIFDRDTDAVRITVQDEGPGFDYRRYLEQGGSPTATHGRGIFLARSCGFDSLEYRNGGRQVVVTVRR